MGRGFLLAFVGVGDDEIALEFNDGGQHPVDHAALRSGGVEPALAEVVQEGHEVGCGAADAVQAGGHEHVADT